MNDNLDLKEDNEDFRDDDIIVARILVICTWEKKTRLGREREK